MGEVSSLTYVCSLCCEVERDLYAHVHRMSVEMVAYWLLFAALRLHDDIVFMELTNRRVKHPFSGAG